MTLLFDNKSTHVEDRSLDNRISSSHPERGNPLKKTQGRSVCTGCDVALPLRAAKLGEDAALWKCAKCERQSVGVCIPKLLPMFGSRVLLGECYFDGTACQEMCYEMWPAAFEVVRDRAQVRLDSGRQERRTDRIAAVEAIQLNHYVQPVGEATGLMLVDISTSGMGLMHTQLFSEPLLAVQLPKIGNRALQVVARVVRQDRLENGYYSIGCQLIYRLGAARSI